eukprot:509808_1
MVSSSYSRAPASRQLYHLLQRNWRLKSRLKKETLFEVCTPAIMFLTLGLMKLAMPSDRVYPPISLRPFDLDEYVFMSGEPLQYVPQTKGTDWVMQRAAELLPVQTPLVPFNKTTDAEVAFERGGVLGTIVFDLHGLSDLNKDVFYTMRFNGTLVPHTEFSPKSLVVEHWPIDQQFLQYQSTGFLATQHAVNHALLEYQRCVFKKNCSEIDYKLRIQRYPTPEYKIDEFYAQFKNMASLYMLAGFLSLKNGFICSVVAEKERKLKDAMLIMGLRESILFVAWWWTYSVLAVVPSAMILGLSWLMGFLQHTPLFYLMLLLMGFVQSMIMLSYFISTFFTKARTAGQVGTMIYFLLFVPSWFITGDSPRWLVQLCCLAAPTAFSNGFKAIIRAEAAGQSVSLFGGAADASGRHRLQLSYPESVGMLCLDFVLYALASLYFDKVWPRTVGITRHPLFCLSPRFWGFFKNSKKISFDRDFLPVEDMEFDPSIEVEPVPNDIARRDCVEIYNLTKTFDKSGAWKRLLCCCCTSLPRFISSWLPQRRRGYERLASMDSDSDSDCGDHSDTGDEFVVEGDEVRAVRGVNLSFYRGQILALLGHNGAGKSTTISMMTGILRPDSGGVRVFGQEFRDNVDEIRTKMGVCPQHDLLFEYMTVDEHLYFFGGIKGVPIDLIDEEANSLMTRLGINHCRKNWAGRLSGGERRKLSVAISLIGKPEVVYLDEPTAGMDPFSRRCVWELLNEEKQKRVIILTTHYMDEADLLGDRIAIMSNGKIRCLGSSLFLKRKFGGGYHLYVSESQNSASNGVGEESDDDDFFVVNAAKTDSWDIRSVEKTVRKIIPSALLNEDSKSQISFSIPMDNVAKFHDLFTALDSAKGRLGVGSYGISLTSLEEVFLRIAAEGEHGGGFSSDEESDSETTESSIIDIFPPADEPHLLTPNSGPASWSGQATGLLLKKLATFRRSMHSYFFKLFWPFSYVTSLLAALRAAPAFQNIAPPSFQLDNNAQYMAFFRDFFVHLAGSTSSAFSNLAKLMDFTSLRRPGSANILGVRPADAIHAILRNATEPTVASVAADTLRFDEGVLNMTLFHNASAPHMSPILMGTVDNALSQLMANCSIHSINHPYPYPHATDFAEISALILPITFGISFPIIADSFGMDAMREKSRRSKHLQLVMGLRPWVYWAANFAFDFTFFLIPIFLMYGCFEWYGEATLMGEAFLPSLSLFLAYGAAALSFSYLLSQYFVRFAAYSTFSTTVKRIISMSLFVACVVLEKVPAVKSCPLFPLLRLLFCLSPQFSLMFGLYQVLVMNQSINQQRELCILRKMPLCVTPTSSDFFALDMMGGTL